MATITPDSQVDHEPKAPFDGETILPTLCHGVTLHDMQNGTFVIKVGAKQAYYHVGEQEFFLLQQLETPIRVCDLQNAFADRFGEQLSTADVQEFIELGQTRYFIQKQAQRGESNAEKEAVEKPTPVQKIYEQSLLFFRVPLFNPNRFLGFVIEHFPWIWTRQFLLFSATAMLIALLLVVANRADLASSFVESWQWETVVLAWITVLVATAIHEMAHGATCRKFGGEVHESGVLFMFFMPCLYCNVSDAWLIPQKYKRLLITAAGGYADLCMWAIAVFVWRITAQDTLVNYLAFIILTVCGTRGLINFNPLMRLDGYYLLSDFLDIPNLYKQGREYWMQHVRWLLWGANRPTAVPRGKLLLLYGMIAWGFAIVFLNVVFSKMLGLASSELGISGIFFASCLLWYAVRRVFRGFFQNEVIEMIQSRPKKTMAWIYGVAGVIAAMFLIPVPFYASGNFEVRPGDRVDIPSPSACFVGRVHVEDGAMVNAGDVLAELHSPELQSQIETKQAELRQSEANLTKLKTGARPEEIAQQESRVKRLTAWYELGNREVKTATQSLEFELKMLDHRIKQATVEVELARESIKQSEKLYKLGALAGAELKQEKTRLMILESQLGEAEAAYQARAAEGIRSVSAEFSRRENELADAEAALSMMKAGARPEEIEAETARRERIVEELQYLKTQSEKLVVRAPVSGLVSAPRMREKVGQFAVQGTLLCQIEQTAKPYVEISVLEDDSIQLQPGQEVRLKARALPFTTFKAIVDRVAPAAATKQGALRNIVVVHCRLDQTDGQLKSGMTGFGRISRGWKTIGLLLSSKFLGYVRTEFWW